MPFCRPAPDRLPAAAGAAFFVVALALCLMAPARAAEGKAQPATDASIRIKAFPPSVQVDTTTKGQPEDATTGSIEVKHGDAQVRIDTGSSKHGEDDFDVDAFSTQVQKMPWVIGVIFLVLSSIFLTPVILLIGIIWYKLRKTRLQNEALLALAAKGIVPPAQAADALATSAGPASVAPQLYQQAVALRKRLVWSDLRKGVLMSMIGLAFLLYGITGSGEPSWVGLILLFVGVGYVALWWLEGRHLQNLQQAGATRPGNDVGPGAGGG